MPNDEAARVTRHKPDALVLFDSVQPDKSIPATRDAITQFIENSAAGIPDANVKQGAIDRMRAALVVDPAKDDTAEIAEIWRKCEEASAKVRFECRLPA